MDWTDAAPAAAVGQVERLLEAARASFGDALADLTLHGSLAMGCFNPARSDIDVLIVLSDEPERPALEGFGERLHALSGEPHPLELSVVRSADIEPFTYPTPYDLHHGEKGVLVAPAGEPRRTDTDLAAHVVMGIARGTTLHGTPLGELTGGVAVADFIDTIWRDLVWLSERVDSDPLYAVLNPCRALHYVLEGILSSKAEGAAWALGVAPEALHPTIEAARAIYGGAESAPLEARPLVAWALEVFDTVRAVRTW